MKRLTGILLLICAGALYASATCIFANQPQRTALPLVVAAAVPTGTDPAATAVETRTASATATETWTASATPTLTIVSEATATISPTPSPTLGATRRSWRDVRNWVYWLSSPDLRQIGASSYQLAVIDYSLTGTEEGRFSRAEIEALQTGGPCRRRVLAYLSIGQAESYRDYWQSGWRPGSPDWIVAEDPDWPENYYVAFWRAEWQAIVFAYLDAILEVGYDGVYLDRVDAVDEPYAAGREAEIRALVIAIAQYARARSPLGEDFGVFPQNGEALGADDGYLAATTGIGVEELYYLATNIYVLEDERQYRETLVDRFRTGARGGLVLNVDYTDDTAQIAEAYSRSQRKGYVPYAADVALDQLRVNAGHEPSCTG
jgi:cysteinyl-tRNA synthetase, unknown class